MYTWENEQTNCYIHGQGRAVFEKGLILNGTFNMNAVNGMGVAYTPVNCKYSVEPDSIEFEQELYEQWLSFSRHEYTLKIGHFDQIQFDKERNTQETVPQDFQKSCIYEFWIYDLKPQLCSYEGTFYDSKYEGFGIQKFRNGSSYAGQFRANKWHGFGKAKWTMAFDHEFYQGTEYEGEWFMGVRHGFGKITRTNGTIEQQHWKRLVLSEDSNQASELVV